MAGIAEAVGDACLAKRTTKNGEDGVTPLRSATRRVRLLLVAVGVAIAPASRVSAVPPSLADVVPREAVAAYLADADGEGQENSGAGSSLGLATFVIDQAHRLGLLSGLDAECRAWFDALASLSVVFEHPHALTLLDVRAAVLEDGGHRLAELHAVLVLQTHGKNSAVEGRIQHLLSTYTNSTESTLETEEREGGTVYTLRDRRMPDWAVLTWGAVGDRYVATIGEGSFKRAEEVLADRTRSLASDAWFQRAFNAAGGASAAIAVYARPGRLYEGADDLFVRKVDRVRRAMLAQNVERGLWTMAFVDRAVVARGYLRNDGVDQLRPLTTHELAGVPEGRLIPEAATGYALFDVEPQELCDTICEAYLAARSPETKQRLRGYWRDLQTKANVSISDDIIAHLGRGVAIHDSPRHPLRLPLAWTIVMPVAGDVAELRRNIDRLAGVWRSELAETGAVRLRKDADGIWYLFFGINGPAVGITDRWLVASFSPEAVRQNMAHLEPADTPTVAKPVAVGNHNP